MLVEASVLPKVIERLKKKEHMGGWDGESIGVIIFTIFWVVLWLVTIVYAVRCVRVRGCKNPDASLIVSALCWPIFWLFKILNVVC